MVNLNNAKVGDLLISQHGMKLRYLKPIQGNEPYNHHVVYPCGSGGTRADNGKVFLKKPLPDDHNIIQIIPLKDADDIQLLNLYELDVEEYKQGWGVMLSETAMMQFRTEKEAQEAFDLIKERFKEPKKGKVINGIYHPDILAENNIENFDEYKSEAVRLAQKMGKINGVCCDSIQDSFDNNIPVGEAAKKAYDDSTFWEMGY